MPRLSPLIDRYLADLPENQQIPLEKLRFRLHELIPDAEEVFSYQLPTLKKGLDVVSFAAFKNHLSFFVLNSTLLSAYTAELASFKTTRSAIHFTAEKPIPDSLIQALVEQRLAENDDRLKKKVKK